MDLQLSLKKIWFDPTKAGIKLEDYREITPYWCNRLLLFDGIKRSVKWWKYNFFNFVTIETTITMIKELSSFKPFENNIMTLGYPKKTDSERILKLGHNGIETRTGNPEWGAEPNKLYFVIKHKIN